MTELLRCTGWRPGRRVSRALVHEWQRRLLHSDGFVAFPAARHALREFGALAIRCAHRGDGGSATLFDLRPLRCTGHRARFAAAAAWVGDRLYPLGTSASGAPLAIGEHGQVLLLGDDGPELLGHDLHEALVELLHRATAAGDAVTPAPATGQS
jgi:hypothetical protein